ncbi:MAG: twin-arginine translocase subunit TatC [Candidatus Cloacimonadota bacterium]|nr:MAG: twin-arginine translocase subunit TatC [Candidatus Cloacimonadota bacterium]
MAEEKKQEEKKEEQENEEQEQVEEKKEEKKMGLLDHLEELRKRIIYSIVTVIVCAIIGYIVSPFVLKFLTEPVKNLVFLSPTEAFITKLKVSLICGIFIALPVLFYHFWKFVKPALFAHERKYVIFAVLFSTIFFFSGAAFAYFVVLPVGLRFLLSFETDKLHATLSIANYITFITKILLAFGIIFQLPVASFFLTKMRILKPRFLRKSRKVAVILIFIAAAILTPPDVFTQLLMAGPLIILFELSIWVSVFASRKPSKKKDEG